MNYAVVIEPNGPSYRDERAAAFAAAKRHSRLVRVLRVGILAGAAGAIVVFVLIVFFNPLRGIATDISVGGLSLDGTRVAMDRPKLAGFRKDGRPYLVNAERAVQDVLHPTVAELRGIDAEIGISSSGVAKVTADLGVYDSATERMELSHNVRVKSDEYDVRLQSANIDFKTGVYQSSDPVTVVTSNGATISADSVAAIDNGRQLIFDGHVKSILQIGEAAAGAGAELKGTDR